MHDYTNARLVADRQLRYLKQAEHHRLVEGCVGRTDGVILA